jgi:hypothetical protein
MTTRNAVRHAIASGRAGDVKALIDDREALVVLKKYLQIPDDKLRDHLRRLVDEVGTAQAENGSDHLTEISSTSNTSV